MVTKIQRYQEAEMELHEAAVEFTRYYDAGHRAYGELRLIEAALDYTRAAAKVTELAEPRGLTFTELEADRNAALGRAPLHAEPIPCYEDDVSRCGCSTCINQPKIPGKRPDRYAGMTQTVQVPFGRPCCHTTGPNHHPACQDKP